MAMASYFRSMLGSSVPAARDAAEATVGESSGGASGTPTRSYEHGTEEHTPGRSESAEPPAPPGSDTPRWLVTLDLNLEAVPLLDAKLAKYQAPASPAVAGAAAAAEADAPCIHVRCNDSKALTPATVVIKLRDLDASTPVVVEAESLAVTFKLAAPVTATAAGVGPVSTRVLTLTLRSDVAFVKLTEWLHACHHHHGVGGIGGRTPLSAGGGAQRQPVFDTLPRPRAAPAGGADSAGRASALEEQLADMAQADFDRLLIRVLELRLHRR